MTFSNHGRTFLACPDLSLGKGKPTPCRGFSRLTFSLIALLGRCVLTAQMENVETLGCPSNDVKLKLVEPLFDITALSCPLTVLSREEGRYVD